MCLCVLSSVLWCLQRFQHGVMFGTSLPPVVCRRTHVIFALLKKMFVHSDVRHFVLSCVFVFWVPCCDFYNDFSMEWCLVCLCFQLFVEGLMFCLYCYTPAPRRGRGVCCFTSVHLFFRPSVLPSFCPSKIFFVAFFSVTVDGRNLIFGHKRHIGIPYCG